MSNSRQLPAGKSNTLKERATEHVDPDVCYDVIQVVDQLVINQKESKQIRQSLDELSGKVDKAIKDGTETANKHERRLNDYDRRIHEAHNKINSHETMLASMKLSLDSNTAMLVQSQKQNIQLIEGLGSRMDNFFTLLKESRPTKSSKPKTTFWNKIPPAAWYVIIPFGCGLLVYAVTGDDSLLKQWGLK